jgi:glycine/D-amino acid oxidase-like deaminating enzyme
MNHAPAPAWASASLRDAKPAVFWTDIPHPPRREPLRRDATADLVVVGGGFTGLWAAIQAKQRDPARDVVLIEARRLAVGASGRNGGFLASTLTHGLDHGAASWPREVERLVHLGRANFAAIADTIAAHGIDADYEPNGQLSVAVTPHQVEHIRASYDLHRSYGEDVQWYDAAALRAQVASPTYLAGYLDRSGCAIVNPAKLAWGLGDVAERLGVRVHEHTELTGLERLEEMMAVHVRTARGTATVTARDVVLGTNAYPSPLRRLKAFVLPVYDHVLMTEPLSAEQMASLGWSGREGVGDGGHQFHYYRLTADNRILWGGYDANYHRGGAVDVALEQRDASHQLLARHFFETFPQLEGLRFSHRWGGAIDTTSRFTPMFGTAHGGRVAYSVGYTGLGVGSSRWGAQVALDLLSGEQTELTSLEMVRRLPVPFPPEPLRYPVVAFTRREIARSDETGRRGAWLAALDAFGVGFDS